MYSTPNAHSTDDLEALVGQAEPFTVAGRKIALSPLKVGELPAFLRAARPVLDLLSDGLVGAALLDDAEAALESTRLAARVDRAFVESLSQDDFLLLAGKVVEVNADFFIRSRLEQGLLAERSKLAALLAGSRFPSASSAPATGMPT